MTRYWIGVASRDHVRQAVEGGFFQVNHGKEAPLRRIANGDRVLFYSPREQMRKGTPIQAFTAIGDVIDDAPYRVVHSDAFMPFRRNVRYRDAREAPIRPLLETLSFSAGKRNWGRMLRHGFFEIKAADYKILAGVMLVS